MANNNNNEILRMENVYKSFPGVQALENVDFRLKRGEIHALVGENGAGRGLTRVKCIMRVRISR